MTSTTAHTQVGSGTSDPAVAGVRIGSLCSGYGGLEMGLQAVVGGTVAWHVEYDKHPSAVLEARFPGVPNYGDVKTADWTAVEPVDWLTAGYPCQPFSSAGKRLGEADERHLWPFVADAIGALRPRRVLLENVANHIALGLDTVLGDLAALGYDATWGLVRAADAGAPHARARVVILATDTANVRHERSGRRRRLGSADGGELVADAAGAARRGPQSDRLAASGGRTAEPRECAGTTSWGAYGPAIRRWERILGRQAPVPTELGRRGHRLSPRFVEWLMGLPDGWVTDVLPRSPALKCLGNGVVPQQAALAVRTLLNVEAVAA